MSKYSYLVKYYFYCYGISSAFLVIDTEDMAFDSEITVQNVSAKLYSKAKDNQNAIAFVKNNTSILIRGNVALDELIKISENLIF